MKQCINVPNILSFFRLISPLIIIVCFLSEKILVSMVVFIIAAISDYLDGAIARKFDTASKFGAILDPLADKTLVISMYVFFMLLDDINWITATIVVARDVLIMCGVLFLKINNYKVEFKPLWSSKVNTSIQLMFLLFVYLGRFVPKLAHINLILEICTIGSAIYSGHDYCKLAIDIIRKKA